MTTQITAAKEANRYPATSAKHFSFANTAVDSVVNATLNLARHSKTILNIRT